jgi:hypothetical protein
MARRTTFKLPGVRAWVENIKNEVSQDTAREIVKDLQFLGPWYSGDFGNNWVVKSGITSIGATKKRRPDFEFLTPNAALPNSKPGTVQAQMPGPAGGVPRARGRKSINYTIGNRMEYRNIAMDLVPGRFDKAKRNTAIQDWFVLYVEGASGASLRRRLEVSTNRVANLPKIKGTFRYKNLTSTLGSVRSQLGDALE